MSEPEPTWALVTGGGTAGHVMPGLAIARALVANGHPVSSVHFVGSERGIETRLVPDAGFSLTVLPGRGIQRRLALANVGAVIGLLRAIVQAFGILRRRRPAVVISLGGYASVPCALWALILRCPIVVAEQNAVPGLANRLVGRFARASAVSFPGTDLPRAEWTGNPVRDDVLAVDRSDRLGARARLGVAAGRKLIVIFGGSLGARRINEAALQALAVWRDRSDLAVRHIIGARDHADVIANVPADLGDLAYTPVEYEDDMASVYAAADLLVCRSGASSIAEIAVVGIASVLVPLPGAPGDHQTANARALVDVDAAVLVPDDELDGAKLVAEVEALLADPDRLTSMGAATAAVARRDAARRVAALAEEHARA